MINMIDIWMGLTAVSTVSDMTSAVKRTLVDFFNKSPSLTALTPENIVIEIGSDCPDVNYEHSASD